MTPQSQISIFLVCVLCICSAACTPGQLSATAATLDTIATAASGVVAVCSALDITPAMVVYATACVAFGELAAKGASAAATELESSDSSAVKAAEIAADLTAAIQAQPNIVPAGTPSNVVAAINTAANALDTFLKTLVPTAPTSASITRNQLAKAISAMPNFSAKLTWNDRSHLRHARNEGKSTMSLAKAWRAAHTK